MSILVDGKRPFFIALGLLTVLVTAAACSATVATSPSGDRSRSATGSATRPAHPLSGGSAPATASRQSTRSSSARVGTAAPVDARQRSSRSAVTVLATVAIKGRAPMTGYSRAQFGSAWTDDNDDPDGHNGCDTRNDILRRDLTDATIKTDSDGCTVLSGTLHDPYTGHVIQFRRSVATSARVQIDHVVALGDAWQKGAQRWSVRTRTDLANDPLNLLAVDGPTNEAKGDGDSATWLPPQKAYRCAYVAREIAVKARYRLWMTQAEHDAAARVLASCPAQQVPHEPGSATITRTSPHPAPSPVSTHPGTAAAKPPADVYYPNCDAVRAAGAAPIYRGQPGYDRELDRDDDGVACED